MSTMKSWQKECKSFVADLAEVGYMVDVFASLNKFSSYLRPQRGRLQQTCQLRFRRNRLIQKRR